MAHALYSPEIKHEAFRQYIDGEGTLHSIAKRLDVPPETVKTWHRRQKWRTKRNDIEHELHQNWRQNHTRVIQDIRARAIFNHFQIVEELQHRMLELLEQDLSTQQLSAVARAAKAAWSSVEKHIVPGRNRTQTRTNVADKLVLVGLNPKPIVLKEGHDDTGGEAPF